MKDRSKMVLEGAITELLKNEYDRYLAADELIVQIDSQVFLGSISKEEGDLCKEAFKIVMEHKNEEINIFEKLLDDVFKVIRPAKTEAEIEGQMTVDEVEKKEE